MARTSRPSFQKRQKEMARQQKQKDKMARRLERKKQPHGSGPVVEESDSADLGPDAEFPDSEPPDSGTPTPETPAD
jgi:hypothetical protein